MSHSRDGAYACITRLKPAHYSTYSSAEQMSLGRVEGFCSMYAALDLYAPEWLVLCDLSGSGFLYGSAPSNQCCLRQFPILVFVQFPCPIEAVKVDVSV